MNRNELLAQLALATVVYTGRPVTITFTSEAEAQRVYDAAKREASA